jgi:hypothetical protein
LIPHGQIGAELRAIARDDVRAARDERRLGNRLRADLLAVFPAAVDIADGDLSAAVFLKLLERWPSADALAAVTREELEAFARSCRHGWPDRFADRVIQTLARPQLTAQSGLVQAKTGSIRLSAAQLLLLRAQRRLWERRMGELLLGGHRPARAKTVENPVQRHRISLELSRVVLVHHRVPGLLSTRTITIPVSSVQDQGATPLLRLCRAVDYAAWVDRAGV